LSLADQLNERIMTGLRTTWGLPKKAVAGFGLRALEAVSRSAAPWLEHGALCHDENAWWLSAEGRFLADGIAADLFVDGDELVLEKPAPGPWETGKAYWGRSPFVAV
jgi:oxygen-independent coproporphyrinogen-3 oxidase